MSGDACINQLLSITHDMYQSFHNGFEVRGVFLDISKAFNKVWHIQGFQQRLVLNGQNSTWVNVEERVPQGSIF